MSESMAGISRLRSCNDQYRYLEIYWLLRDCDVRPKLISKRRATRRRPARAFPEFTCSRTLFFTCSRLFSFAGLLRQLARDCELLRLRDLRARLSWTVTMLVCFTNQSGPTLLSYVRRTRARVIPMMRRLQEALRQS